jgi:protein-L-isoaspartate(D-aspartate) O-methyltransferase
MEQEDLIRELIDGGFLKTPLLIEAFYKIDRKDFVLDEYRDEAYGNYPLHIGFDQTISQPLTVAFMLELLAPRPGERILEIGSGSGWVTALLAYVVSAGKPKAGALGFGFDVDQLTLAKPRAGKVVAIERIPRLREMTEENAEKYHFIEKKVVEVIEGDGSKGYLPHAPYHRVIAAAAHHIIPVAWKQQCRVGGRIVAPVGDAIEVHEKLSANDFIVREYKGFRFVPLVTDDGGG